MSARAPAAIEQLWGDIHKLIPRAVLSGIVGNVQHSFGYHLARHDLPADDYSVVLASDKLGKGDCASALDISLPPDLMTVLTQRLHTAAVAHDPRLHALREFCGTLNGRDTFPWDVFRGDVSEGINTWDDSHLWHIHLSFLREWADDYAHLAPIAQVLGGVPLKHPPNHPNWSDTVTKEEIQKLIDDAQRAAMYGGNVALSKRAPGIYPDKAHGLDDRLKHLEAEPGVKP